MISSAITNAGRLKPISKPKSFGAFINACACATRSGECAALIVDHFLDESLRPRNQRCIRRHRHLAGDSGFGRAQRRPMVIGQPQRHLEVENIQQLDEVIGPSGRNRAGAHRVFERQVPADDPGEDFAQRRIGIGVGAAGQRNHGRKFRIAERRQTRSPDRTGRRRASGPGPA